MQVKDVLAKDSSTCTGLGGGRKRLRHPQNIKGGQGGCSPEKQCAERAEQSLQREVMLGPCSSGDFRPRTVGNHKSSLCL